MKRSRRPFRFNNICRGVWVPAFAGTTEKLNRRAERQQGSPHKYIFSASTDDSTPSFAKFVASHSPAHFRPWSLLTYSFFHESFGHLLVNVFYLWIFGGGVEEAVGVLLRVRDAHPVQLHELGVAADVGDHEEGAHGSSLHRGQASTGVRPGSDPGSAVLPKTSCFRSGPVTRM